MASAAGRLTVPDDNVGRTVELVSAFCGHPLGKPQRGAALSAEAGGAGAATTTLAATAALLASAAAPSRPNLLGATPEEQARAREWLTWAATDLADGAPALDDRAAALEAHLRARTYLAGGPGPTVADVAAFGSLHPYLRAMPPAQAGQYACVRRWADLIQHVAAEESGGEGGEAQLQALFGRLALVDLQRAPFVFVPPPPVAAAAAAAAPSAAGASGGKDNGKKGGGAAAAAAAAGAGAAAAAAAKGGGKKGGGGGEQQAAPEAAPAAPAAGGDAKSEKKKKEAKPAAPAAAKPEDDPRADHLDLRVGLVTDIGRHPNAESLYVEQIDLGEASGPRQVISGLVKFVTEEEMRGRRVVVACNLKAAKMRDVMSYGMVMCASNAEHTAVVPLDVPAECKPGDRVWFGPSYDRPPVAEINGKKSKLLELILKDCVTDADGNPTFKGERAITTSGPVTSTMPNAHVG